MAWRKTIFCTSGPCPTGLGFAQSLDVLLCGNLAKRANFFRVSSRGGSFGHQSAMSDSFSLVEPASDCTGVVAGTKVVLRDAGMDVGVEEERMAARRTWLVRCRRLSGWTLWRLRGRTRCWRMSAWALVAGDPLVEVPEAALLTPFLATALLELEVASVDALPNMPAGLVSGLALSSYDKDTFRGVRAVMELCPKDAVLVPGTSKNRNWSRCEER